jgi:hypothetical protein
VSAEQRQEVEREVERIVYRFFQYLDTRQYEKLADLMAPDGVWNRMGKALKGRDMLMTAMRARPMGFTTLHVVTNFLVEIVDETHAEADYYMTAYAHQLAEGKSLPAPSEAPFVIGSYKQKFVRLKQGWRIADIDSTNSFQRS